MVNIIALCFTKEFSSQYEPAQLLLGSGIGIVIVVILVKKQLTEEITNELLCKLSESIIEKVKGFTK
ncbi:MAG: hypothetical protein OER82_08895 [Nitrosopumilus sp.]|nr:hypothetical protein [Nitrosopumilus sp.]